MNQAFPPLQPQIVLAVGAHPDDMDFGAGGTLATFAAQGAKVHYLQITDGGSGSEDPNITSQQLAAERRDEQEAACRVIGGVGVTFLDHCDGQLEVSLELKKQIVQEIRTVKPDVVITMDPTMVYSTDMGFINHPDHRAAGQATLDAVYPLARDHLSFPELYEDGYEPHKVATLLLLNFNQENFYVDVTDSFETKLAAVRAHASQVEHNYEAMKQLFTNMAEHRGNQAGCGLAESFMRIDVS